MINCYLCEKIFLPNERFHLYLCYDCHNYTSFCLNCDRLIMKIFENHDIFKCGACRKIVPTLQKQPIEITNLPGFNQLNLSNINGIVLSPIKNNDNENHKNNENSINNNEINNNNENNINNNIIFNNNTNMNSPFKQNYINPLTGNKISINTPSSYSSFFSDFKNNNNTFQNVYDSPLKNNNNDININSLSTLTDTNNNSNSSKKVKKDFYHLVSNDNSMTLIKNKKRISDYFNTSVSKELKESFNKKINDNDNNNNKSNYVGYNKKSKIINNDKYFK